VHDVVLMEVEMTADQLGQAIAVRGVDPVEVLSMLRGDWQCGYDSVAHRVAPRTTPPATRVLHAVGVGHASRLKGGDTVVMAQCGDGATSEGDVHEALDFAAVLAAPVVSAMADL
jgi:2-oxoisovalerate dehydrogenase E1 component alpha subunit